MNRPRVARPAALYPPHVVDALVEAAQRRDHRAIDDITDELAKAGFCRPRKELGRFESIADLQRGGAS